MNNDKSGFFLVREEILPEAIKKTIRVKEMLKRGDARRDGVVRRVLQAGIEVAVGLQVKQLAHVLAGGVLEGGGLDDGDLAGFAVAGGIAALYAQGIDAVFAGLIHDLTSFPQKR